MPFGSVGLAWDRNGEADLAGYRIYYGPSAVSLPYSIDVGQTATPLTPAYILSTFQIYGPLFFSVRAYDTAVPPNESVNSNVITTPIAPVLSPFSWP